jgi:hypothetical protein
LAEKIEWIQSAKNLEELKRLFTQAYNLASAAKDKKAMAVCISAKDKRKAELA